MEFPARVAWTERALLGAALLIASGVAWLESRSPVAAAIREGKPVMAWFAVETPTDAVPQLFLLYAQPGRGTAELIYVPETTPIAPRETLAKVYAASRREGGASRDGAKAMADAVEPWLPGPAERFYFMKGVFGQEERPIEGARWLKRQGFWRGKDFELARLGIELNSLGEDGLHPAYLPEQKEIPSYFARLSGASASSEPSETQPSPTSHHSEFTVEVLNATPKAAVASTFTKLLRLHGVDVLSTGNAPASGRTVVYDRVGHPELAARVRELLGCDTAVAVTRVDPKRVVDVSVVVGADCAR